MKKTNVVIFRMICVFLLVFTTLAPSIASANTGRTVSVTIHTGSEDRGIRWAEGYIQGSGQNGIVPLQVSWLENGSLKLEAALSQYDGQPITVALSVHFNENGQQFQLIDEVVLTGDDMEYLIPETGSLLETKIADDMPGMEFDGHIGLGDNQQWDWNAFPISKHERIVSPTNIRGYLRLKAEEDGKVYLLRTQFTTGTSIDFATLTNNTFHFEFDAIPKSLTLSEENGQGYVNVYNINSKHFVVSDGSYYLSYETDEFRWNSLDTIDGSQTVILPTIPTDLVFNFTNQYVNQSNEIQLNYNLILGTDRFSANPITTSQVNYSLSDETGTILEWKDSYRGGTKLFEASELASGLYTFKVSMEVNGNLLSAEKELLITSPENKLKGTVITAETITGEMLQSGTVSLYEVIKHGNGTSANLEKTVEIQLDNGNYEAFFPDAYILDGREYLLTIVNETEKFVYTKRFIGQSKKSIHLDAAGLKELNMNTGSLSTVNAFYVLLDNNLNPLIPLNIQGLGWKIDTETDMMLSWVGKDNEENGYLWNGLARQNSDQAIDITTEEWRYLKPASIYPKAYFQFRNLNESFKSLRISGDTFYEYNKALLVVEDENFLYKGAVHLYTLDPGEEVGFSPFSGSVYLKDADRTIGTHYWNQQYDQLEITSKSATKQPSFTYDVYDSQKNLVESVTTNTLDTFKLQKPLKNGNYNITLSETNIDSEIVSLEMDHQLRVFEGNPVENQDQTQLTKTFLQTETRYGDFQRHNARIQINRKSDGDQYEQTYYYHWTDVEQAFSSLYPISISAEDEYEVTIILTEYMSGKMVVDEQRMTGSQLLAIDQNNPLQVTDGLHQLKLNVKEKLMNVDVINLSLQKVDVIGPELSTQFPLNSEMEIYLPERSYLGALSAQDNNANVRIMPLPEFKMNEDKSITLDPAEFAKYTFGNEKDNLSIIGYETYKEYAYFFSPETHIKSVSYPKGSIGDLHFYIASRDQHVTPWGYGVKAPTKSSANDRHFNFNISEIKGVIDKVEVINEQHSARIAFKYKLTAEDLEISSIHRAVERNSPSLLSADEDPIRDYVGLFDRWNQVNAKLTLIDSTGKAVWDELVAYGVDWEHGIFIPKALKSGTYDFQIQIPIASGKSITLNKPVTIIGEGDPFIQITSPKDNAFSNGKSLNVTGITNANKEVYFEIHHEGRVIVQDWAMSDHQGLFSKYFSLPEGIFTLVTTVGEARAETTFTIDRTPPESIRDIKFTRDGSKLIVNWPAAQDAIAYTVEVAKNEKPFVVVSEKQSDDFITIRDIEPNTAYHVRIISYDRAGNMSESETATYKVAGDGGSTGTPGDGGSTGGNEGNPGNGGDPSDNIGGGTSGGNDGKQEEVKPIIPPTPDSNVGQESIEEKTGEKTVVVSNQYVEKQISDAASKEIVIPISKEAGVDKISVSVTESIWQLIQASKKPLVISENGAKMTIPAETINAIQLESGENAFVSIATLKETGLPKISNSQTFLSPLFDFTIAVKKENEERKVTAFAKPVTVTVKVNEAKNAAKVAAFYLNVQNGKWEYVGGKLNSDTFTFNARHFSQYAILENDKTFSDIHNAKVGWAAEYIEVLASKNIIQGKTEDTFGPSEDITRAQFAALLSRALNLPKQPYTGTFSDVTSRNGAALDIEAANRAGIVGGENGKFHPNEKITRQQMAAMIIRALEYKDPAILNGVNSKPTFKDTSSISDYAKKYVDLAGALGIINGREEVDGFHFAPKENATRAHAAKMLYQFLELD